MNFKTVGEARRFCEQYVSADLIHIGNVFELAEGFKKAKESGCSLYIDPQENCSALKQRKEELKR